MFVWFLQGGIGYPNTGVFTIIQNNHKTITTTRPFWVVLSIVNAAFSIQLLDGEDCNISSLEGFPIPVAHLLHLCGSWKEGQSQSHPRQLTVNSSLKQCTENFNKLWLFIQLHSLGQTVQLFSSPTGLFAMDNFLIYDLRILRTLHRRWNGTLALWGLWRECLLAMGPAGTSKQGHGLLWYHRHIGIPSFNTEHGTQRGGTLQLNINA